MTTLEFEAKKIEVEAKAERSVDIFTAACVLIVVFLVSFEFWRFAS